MARLKRNEWRDAQGITEEEMQKLEALLAMSGGKIVRIVDNPERRLL